MQVFSTLKFQDSEFRELTVWEATKLSQFSEEGIDKGMDYFLSLIPSIKESGSLTEDVLRCKASIALELYNNYRMWLFNPLTEQEIHELAQDCTGTFEGRKKHKMTPYHDWISNLFLPLLDNEKGVLIREVFPGTRSEQPYRSDLIIRVICSIYCEWANRKREQEMKKHQRK